MIPPRFIPPILTPEQQELLNRSLDTKLDIMYNKHEDTWLSQFRHNFKLGFRTRWPYMTVAMFVIAGLVLSPTHSFISALLLVGLFIFTALGLVTSLLHMYLTRHTLFDDVELPSRIVPSGYGSYVLTPPQGGDASIPVLMEAIRMGVLTHGEIKQQLYPTVFEYEAAQIAEEPTSGVVSDECGMQMMYGEDK